MLRDDTLPVYLVEGIGVVHTQVLWSLSLGDTCWSHSLGPLTWMWKELGPEHAASRGEGKGQ